MIYTLICIISIRIAYLHPFTSTTCLQSLNLYFIMERRKLTPIVTPNTLESMIEYTFISSILNYVK